MHDANPSHPDLQATAKEVMQQRGFQPEFPSQALQQVAELKNHPPKVGPTSDIRDLRNLLWSSIDNDTSRDLDQIEVAESLPNGDVKIMIGIADVDAFVPRTLPSINTQRAKLQLFMPEFATSPCCQKNYPRD